MNNTYLLIGGVFVANLIISLILRISLKNSKSMKKTNDRFNAYRKETNMNIQKLEETYKNCEQGITMRIEEANSVIAQVAETLDIIFVHQKELSQLDDVCKNYKIALEKLKIQTEQAEARIHAVQAEVRKAEAVDSFVIQFQQDAERLTNQMQDLKSEYVRLVASTEQALKVAGQNQMDENNQMLSSFAVSLERFKVQFSDFISSEKAGFADICRQQEIIASNNLNVLSEKSLEIHESIDQAMANLASFRGELENSTSELEERKDEAIKAISDAAELHQNAIKAFGDSEENSLQASLKAKEEEIAKTIESFGMSMQVEADKVSASVSELEERRNTAIATIEEAEKRYATELKHFYDESSEMLVKQISEREAAVKTTIDSFSSIMEEKETGINSAIASLDERAEALSNAISEKFKNETENVEFALRRLEDSKNISVTDFTEKMMKEEEKVEQSILKLEGKRDLAVSIFEDKIAEKEEQAATALNTIDNRREQVILDLENAVAAKKEELKTTLDSMDSEREAYVVKCREALDKSFSEVVAESDVQIGKLKVVGDEMMRHLAERISDSKEAVILLNETSREKINESIDTLSTVEKRIADQKEKLASLGEEITSKKQQVWELNMKLTESQQQLETIQGDMTKAQDEATQAKATRVQEEANILRLKAQSTKIKAQKDEEEADRSSRKAKARKPQDMFEAFPEDIFIGEEESVKLEDD